MSNVRVAGSGSARRVIAMAIVCLSTSAVLEARAACAQSATVSAPPPEPPRLSDAFGVFSAGVGFFAGTAVAPVIVPAITASFGREHGFSGTLRLHNVHIDDSLLVPMISFAYRHRARFDWAEVGLAAGMAMAAQYSQRGDEFRGVALVGLELAPYMRLGRAFIELTIQMGYGGVGRMSPANAPGSPGFVLAMYPSIGLAID